MAWDEIGSCAACAAAEAEWAAAAVAAGDAESFDGAGEAATLQTVCGLVGGSGSDAGCCNGDGRGGGGNCGGMSRCGSGGGGDTGSGADMDDVSLDFGSEDEETVVVGVTHVGLDGGDGCCSAGEACTDEVEIDADMASVSVAKGTGDGLLAAEVMAAAGVSVETCIDEAVLHAAMSLFPLPRVPTTACCLRRLWLL